MLNKGDIVKVVCDDYEKLGLVSEEPDGTMVQVGKKWFDLEDCEVTVLHSEVDKDF